jgi:S-adenosylmethionine hydrolase
LGFSLPSRTFHGRDLFAPVAALIAASKLPFAELGPLMTPQGKLYWPEVSRSDTGWLGQVVVVDRFGNLISNIEPGAALAPGSRAQVGATSVSCRGTYGDVQPGELVAYLGSFGQLEIAVRNGSAAARLNAQRGTPIHLEGQ